MISELFAYFEGHFHHFPDVAQQRRWHRWIQRQKVSLEGYAVFSKSFCPFLQFFDTLVPSYTPFPTSHSNETGTVGFSVKKHNL